MIARGTDGRTDSRLTHRATDLGVQWNSITLCLIYRCERRVLEAAVSTSARPLAYTIVFDMGEYRNSIFNSSTLKLSERNNKLGLGERISAVVFSSPNYMA